MDLANSLFRVFARTDDFMRLVMEKLNLPIPQWHLVRYVCVNLEGNRLSFDAVDCENRKASNFKKLTVDFCIFGYLIMFRLSLENKKSRFIMRITPNSASIKRSSTNATWKSTGRVDLTRIRRNLSSKRNTSPITSQSDSRFPTISH